MQSTTLAFHELSFVRDGREVMVGRPDTDSYALFPVDGAELLRRLVQGEPVPAASAWYEETYGEPVDMDDFLALVDELGFVRDTAEEQTTPQPPGSQWTYRLGRALFSPLAWLCYGLLFAGTAFVLVHQPVARPWRANEFYVKSLTFVELTYIFGQIPGLMLHESFHMLAARRLGLPVRLTIGLRLYFLVFETQLKGILGQPRRSRYLAYLAGMLADILWFSSLTVIGVLCLPFGGVVNFLGRLSLALAFPTVFRLIWQLWVVLRTDIYYVIVTALGCADLHGASMAVLRNAWWRLLRQPHRLVDTTQWSGRDRRLAKWYAPISVLMTAFLILLAVNLVIPVMSDVIGSSVQAMRDSHGFDWAFWDTTIALILAVVPFFAATGVWLRRLVRARHASMAAAVLPTATTAGRLT